MRAEHERERFASTAMFAPPVPAPPPAPEPAALPIGRQKLLRCAPERYDASLSSAQLSRRLRLEQVERAVGSAGSPVRRAAPRRSSPRLNDGIDL